MTDRPVALGLVGCGRLAEVGYLPAIAANDGVSLIALADADPQRLASVASTAAGPGAEPASTWASAGELIEGAEVDALVLATPAVAHLADARLAASAGLPTLVEKPPAPDVAGAESLLELTPSPCIGFNRRFDAGAVALRELVPEAGEVDLRLDIGYRRRGWGAHQVADDAWLDLGPHLVDWARWLTSSEVIEVVSADLSHDEATVVLRLERGRAVLHASTDSIHRERIEVRSADGRVARHHIGGLVGAVIGRLPFRGPGALVATLTAQLAAFADLVRHGHSPTPPAAAADGWAAMMVIEAARVSASDDRPILSRLA